MLVVSNGAFKSGSTWLFSVAKILVPHQPLPDAFRAPGWKNDSLHQPVIQEFLKTVDRRTTNFVVKNHLEKLAHRDLLLGSKDVLVLSIRRDLRDTIVSAYYHDVRNKLFTGDFNQYFEGRGKERLYEISRYHRVWEKTHPNLFQTTYEDFHRDFDGEVRRLAAFLGVSVASSDIEDIREKTSFDRVQRGELQNKGENNALFFRKGVVGDWENHLSDSMQSQLNRIVAQVQKEPPGYIQRKSSLRKILSWIWRLKKLVPRKAAIH